MASLKSKNTARKGLIKDRTQFKNPATDRYVKRDSTTGRILDVKADEKPFRRVRQEK